MTPEELRSRVAAGEGPHTDFERAVGAASREQLLRLFQASRDLYFDELPLRQRDLSALDTDAVAAHLAELGLEDEVEEPARILRAWRMTDGDHPTVGGLVVFGRRPQDTLLASGVVVGAYDGNDPGDDLLDRKDLVGNLFGVVEQIAAPIRVFVFTDRVEVHSPGRSPDSVDADAMRSGVHVPRNPHIYSRVVAGGLATACRQRCAAHREVAAPRGDDARHHDARRRGGPHPAAAMGCS